VIPTTSRRPGRARVGVAVAAVALLGTCGGSDDGGNSDTTAPAEVVMELVAFKPERLEVEAGTTVIWQQRDAGAHTVTSGTVEQGAAGVTPQPDDVFDSGQLATGETFEHTLDEPGTYPYFCSLHPATMRGEIRVT
jgi:plastocyanin